MMASVNTILGPIPADALGVTLIHEHLACGFPGWECDAVAAPYDRDAVVRVCVEALRQAKQCGLRTLVGATPMDLGRDVALQKRVVIGHMCGNASLEYHISVLDKGVYVAFDRFGVDAVFPDALRKACLIGLLGIGYARQIMLSHDYIAQILGRPMAPPEVMRAALPNWSFTHIFRNVIPALRETGGSDDTIDTMMVENPRRLFAGG